MSGLTFEQLDLKEAGVKNLLDQPAVQYLKTATIQAILNRAFNLVDYQININVDNQEIVINAINAIAAWHSFGAYGQSISGALQLQDIGAFKANLEHYKEIAMMYTALLGIDLERDSSSVVDDAIPVIGFGFSVLDK